MSTSKFEKDALKEIKQLDEGLGLTLLKFFFKGKVRRMLKKMEDDPEVVSAVQGIEYHGKELPSGDYWYVVKLNDSRNNREFVGHFTLYR